MTSGPVYVVDDERSRRSDGAASFEQRCPRAVDGNRASVKTVEPHGECRARVESLTALIRVISNYRRALESNA
jgi:hypothetical protein